MGGWCGYDRGRYRAWADLQSMPQFSCGTSRVNQHRSLAQNDFRPSRLSKGCCGVTVDFFRGKALKGLRQ